MTNKEIALATEQCCKNIILFAKEVRRGDSDKDLKPDLFDSGVTRLCSKYGVKEPHIRTIMDFDRVTTTPLIRKISRYEDK